MYSYGNFIVKQTQEYRKRLIDNINKTGKTLEEVVEERVKIIRMDHQEVTKEMKRRGLPLDYCPGNF